MLCYVSTLLSYGKVDCSGQILRFALKPFPTAIGRDLVESSQGRSTLKQPIPQSWGCSGRERFDSGLIVAQQAMSNYFKMKVTSCPRLHQVPRGSPASLTSEDAEHSGAPRTPCSRRDSHLRATEPAIIFPLEFSLPTGIFAVAKVVP
jgi:hypothetical protein